MDRWVVDVINKRLVQNYIEEFRDEPSWPEDYAVTVVELPESKLRIAAIGLGELKKFAAGYGWGDEHVSHLTPPPGFRSVLFVGMDDKAYLALFNEAGMVAKAGAA